MTTNPAILGALIGAIPGTIAASLTTWTSIRASNANQAQMTWTLASEHDRWLRERRSEVYVDMLTYTNNAEANWNILEQIDNKEITEQVKKLALETEQTHTTAVGISSLGARAGAYTSTATSYAFVRMWNADWVIWDEVQRIIDSGNERMIINDELATRIRDAREYADKINEMAAYDLQTPPPAYIKPVWAPQQRQGWRLRHRMRRA